MKAGKAQSGAFAVEKTIRAGKAKLVILEETASEATKARYEQLCASHGVPLLMISAGGSSTVSFMLAIGISQAVIRAYKRNEIA